MKESCLYLFLLLLLAALPVLAQPATAQPSPPDCVIFFQFTGDASGTQTSPNATFNPNGFDNRFLGCTSWTIQYTATASAGTLTGLTVQSSPGAASASGFVTYAGTVDTGINPNTSNTGAISSFSNGTVDIPWVRVLFTEGTFVGSLNGILYGYRTGYSGSVTPGGGGCPNPCPVEGVDADGDPATVPPVIVSGVDPNGDNQQILTDVFGGVAPALSSLAGADGESDDVETFTSEDNNQLYTRNRPSVFNGASWDRQFLCNSVVAVSETTVATNELIPLASSQTIKLCGIAITTSSSTDIQFFTGTGTNCGTGTTALGGVYQDVATLFLPKDFLSGIISSNGGALCMSQTDAVTVSGSITYVQY